MTHKNQKAPARWQRTVAHVREVKDQRAKEEAAREEKRKRQEPIAFWMKRELKKEDDGQSTTEIKNWRMLVQMPPGVWLRTWDRFGDGVVHYVSEFMDDAAHLKAHLPHRNKVWWEIEITAWGVTLAYKIGDNYPEMMRQCFSESLERAEASLDHFMPEDRRNDLIEVLREGEVIIQDWIARYAQKEQ
jgi:hypothetical protein